MSIVPNQGAVDRASDGLSSSTEPQGVSAVPASIPDAIRQHSRSEWERQMTVKRWRPGKSAPKNREIFGKYPEGYFAIRWAPWAECFQASQTGDYFRDPDQWTEAV
jgi:hypothetical protein